MADEQNGFETEPQEAVDASFTKIEDEGVTEADGASEEAPEEETVAEAKKPGFFREFSERVQAKRDARNEQKVKRAQERAEKAAAKAEARRLKKEERKRKWEAGRKKRRRIFAGIMLLLVLILTAGGAVYYRYVKFFGTHFYRGTTINGIDVSYQTVDDVKREIERRVAKYVLSVKTKDGTERLSAKDVGWKYVDDQKVDELLAAQEPWTWIVRMSHPETYQVSAGTTYDKKKTEGRIVTMDCLTKAVVDPVDAVLSETANGSYEILPETEGSRVDEEKLRTAVFHALDTAAEQIDIVKDDCYVHPAVYHDDETLVQRMNDWNKYLSISITYKFGAASETINANDLKRYIRDDGEKVHLSTDWINMLVFRWSKKYDTFGEERDFTAHSGQVVRVPGGGDYGWLLNREKMIADLKGAIEAGESGSRAPIWLFEASGWEHNSLGTTYAEVSLAEQRLWLYRDGQMIMECDVVTGRPGQETTPGIFSLDEKEERAAKAEGDPTVYRCPFNGNQGLCNAIGRTGFGGMTWQSDGTDGSIEVPSDKMQILYETLSEGDAIVIY